ncbi:MAG: YlbL family protein [Actinomycetota bacterium]
MEFPSILLPEPPRAKRRWWRLAFVMVVLGVTVGLVGAYVQIPYYSLGPGPARDVSMLISVDGERIYPSAGSFFLTTVSVSSRPVTLFEALSGWLDPAVSLVKRELIVTPGLDDQQQDQLINALDMEQSKYSAVIAALHAVGIKTPPVKGVHVIAVAQGFPAAAVLRAGDLIVAANGVAVKDVRTLVERIQAKPVGTKHTFEVLRGQERLSLSVRTIASPITQDKNVPIIGAALGPAFRLPLGVTLDSQNIGGPSAGLAFALTIADVLIPEDLTRGHRVAVTGTIAIDGTVGLVGGVEFKVRAAEHEGADVFLVPKEEVAQASAVDSEVMVIGVSTLEEAITALRQLAQVAPKKAA